MSQYKNANITELHIQIRFAREFISLQKHPKPTVLVRRRLKALQKELKQRPKPRIPILPTFIANYKAYKSSCTLEMVTKAVETANNYLITTGRTMRSVPKNLIIGIVYATMVKSNHICSPELWNLLTYKRVMRMYRCIDTVFLDHTFKEDNQVHALSMDVFYCCLKQQLLAIIDAHY
jgi:hypothetical protein